MSRVGFQWILLSLGLVVIQAEKQPQACGSKPADVFFVLDSSGSIRESEFLKEKIFTEDVANMFDLKDDIVRVGLLSFSDTVQPQFELGDYDNENQMVRKMSEMEHLNGGTETAKALQYLVDKGMSPKKMRPNIPHIAIVLTDGMSADPDATKAIAKKVHDAGISVFVIGIGPQVDKIELEAIGSKPSRKYVFMIDNFDALTSIREKLAITACDVKPIAPVSNLQNTEAEVSEELATYGRCVPRRSLDIVFAVDTAAVGASNTKFILNFITNISDRIGMTVSQSTISVIDNGCSGGTIKGEPAADSHMVRESLSSFSTPQFYQLMRNMRLKARDGRMQSAHIGMLFATDELPPSEFHQALLETMRAKFQKTTIFVLGIGNRVNPEQYRKLTANGGLYITVDSFESLEKLDLEILKDLCIFGIN